MLLVLGYAVAAHSQVVAPPHRRYAEGVRRNLARDSYVLLDSADLDQDTLRPPQTAREMAFVAALEKILKQEGPALWRVVVLSAPISRPHAPDVPTLATTRRIMLRDDGGESRPAAAIVLNSLYWGVVDPPRSWADGGLATVVARHELHHVRRAWLRARDVIAHADTIEQWVRGVGSPPVYRKGLELMVDQSLAAREEIKAIDQSLGSAVLLVGHRQRILQYQEENRLRDLQVVKKLMGLFSSVRDPRAREEIQRWLTDLLDQYSGEQNFGTEFEPYYFDIQGATLPPGEPSH